MVQHVVIMAGGAGKRLWPASNRETPKQLLELNKGHSLLYGTLERALALGIKGKILIVTHQSQVEGCLKECSAFPQEKQEKIIILAEPVAKNTAPALALAACWIKAKASEHDTLLVLAADHLITPVEAFCHDVEAAVAQAEQGFLVTFGITPTFASTGYGYIEMSGGSNAVRDVLSFREKPDKERAQEFLKKGNYLWNSGMFVYSAKVFLEELSLSAPTIYKPFTRLDSSCFPEEKRGGVTVPRDLQPILSVYNETASDSVDYAVMEKSSRIKVVPATMEWNDIGSWDVIADEALTLPSDVLDQGKGRNYVYSDMPVALCGVENLIVVVKNGVVMICRRGESQLVKNVVENLKESGRNELL